MKGKLCQMRIGRIEEKEDRLILYARGVPAHFKYSSEYHVIAKTGAELEVGDTILYEPVKDGFGWFVQKVEADYKDEWMINNG